MPQDDELGRQRPLVALDQGIDAGGIGLEHGSGVRREIGEIGFGDAIDAEDTEKLVGAEAGLAEQLREPAGADPPAHFHLPEPILGVHVAEREGGVGLRAGIDVRDAVPVADDLDGRAEAGHPNFADDDRQ